MRSSLAWVFGLMDRLWLWFAAGALALVYTDEDHDRLEAYMTLILAEDDAVIPFVGKPAGPGDWEYGLFVEGEGHAA